MNAVKNQTTPTRRPMEVADDPRLSPGTKTFLAGLNGSGLPPLETMTPAAAREVLASAQRSVEVDVSGIEETQRQITAGAYDLTLDLVRPAGAKGRLPVFVFVHGGGWVLGDYPTHRRLVRDLVVGSGCAAVFVNYTRTPEAHYPQPVEEVYAATKWVAAHGDELDVDSSRLAIVGNSVGGNMSAVTCILAKQRGGPALEVQILLWPILDHDFETESYREFGEHRFLSTSLMKWMYDLYTKDPTQRSQIYASPLRAAIEELRGLPPALIQVAESDILRDEGEAYGRKLADAGVPTATVRHDGMIHDFGLLNGLAREPGTRAMIALAAARLRSAFGLR
jgi:acetyl esterase